MASRHDNELIGRIWCDRYEIVELIGKGGMGTVYKARQLQIDREVALKVIHRKLTHDEKSVARFEKEARASSKLHHPNNIRVYDYGRSDDDRLFIAMEFLAGQTLGDLISNEGPLHPQRVVHITRQIAKSLSEAHQVGLVHRDLKPENIFICDIHGEPDFVKVLDFGIAKAVGPGSEHANLTQTGFICGTPRYISPEQALGQPVDGRSDLYAVSVLMYEMPAGRPPFMGENPISIVMMHVYDDPPPLVGLEKYGELGERLTRLINHMLQKNPARRPENAEKVIQFLEARIPEDELVSRPVTNPMPSGGRPDVGGANRLPSFQELSKSGLSTFKSGDEANEGHVPMPRALPTDTDRETLMVPRLAEARTPSEAPTSFTSQPRSIAPLGPGDPTDPDKVRPFGTDTDETVQINQTHLEDALKLLKSRRKPPQGLVRRRPSSTDNFHRMRSPTNRQPKAPTPTGSTGLALRTIEHNSRRAPMWALVTMGICIGIILLAVGGFLISQLSSKSDESQVKKDPPTQPDKTPVKGESSRVVNNTPAPKAPAPKPRTSQAPQPQPAGGQPTPAPPKKSAPVTQPTPAPVKAPPSTAAAPTPTPVVKATAETTPPKASGPSSSPSRAANPAAPTQPTTAAVKQAPAPAKPRTTAAPPPGTAATPPTPQPVTAKAPIVAAPFTGGRLVGVLLAQMEPPPTVAPTAKAIEATTPEPKSRDQAKSPAPRKKAKKRVAKKVRKKARASGEKKKKKKKKKKRPRIPAF